MAGNPNPVVAADPKFRGYLPAYTWTLCLGAGISRGIAPDWAELTKAVLLETYGANLSEADLIDLFKSTGWSLDSWIQAAANEHILRGKSSEAFNELIESVLYSKIREKAKGLGIEQHLTRVLNFPMSEPKGRVIKVCEFIENEFGESSLVQMASFLIAAVTSGNRPKAVLTFNADTFLETYIDLRLRRDHYLGPGPHGHPDYYFKQVAHTSHSNGQKIPIIHCHGCIAPQRSGTKKTRDSRGRLVFLEQDYLAIASSGGNWAETVFLFHAQSSKMAFVGLSMSDSNIRRWMSTSNIECSRDRKMFDYTQRPNPDHIWVRPEPKTENQKNILLTSLHHLGVRPGWIDSWALLEDGLRNLCAVPHVKARPSVGATNDDSPERR